MQYDARVPYTWLPIALEKLRGIEPYEVFQALHAARRLPVRASHGALPVLTIWARTAAGRPLIVALRPLSGRDYEIVGASEMNAEQLRILQQWEETRNDQS